jgi:hypothetical protein
MTKLYWHLALTAVIAFGGVILTLLLARFGAYGDLMFVILFAGTVGAVVNNYYRLARLSAAENGVLAQLDNKVITLQIYVSMLIAGILGFVMYGLCVSGLLEGVLFPKFTNANLPYEGMQRLLTSLTPKENIDTAKAILWAFIAGFSERLIPNILDRMVARAEVLESK